MIISGFTATLRPSLALGSFRSLERDVTRLEASLEGALGEVSGWRWGGGAACERLTGHLLDRRLEVATLPVLIEEFLARMNEGSWPDAVKRAVRARSLPAQ